jgi:transitional endoplasmic reticulum ATPase
MRIMAITLCPTQQRALDHLRHALPLGNIFVVSSPTGLGRTTVLREIQTELDAAFLDMKNFLAALQSRHPHALEETFEQTLLDALSHNDAVIVDDLHLLTCVVGDCNMFYPRKGLLDGPMTTLAVHTIQAGKKLIFGSDHNTPAPVSARAHFARIKEFDPSDYQCVCASHLGQPTASRLDFQKIFRFARELNAHQIKAACQWFQNAIDTVDTERFIDYLRSQRLSSNVDLGEVQQVDLRDLQGVDDVIRSLEANIIVPLENDKLAAELNLKPKRGVLLAGPPGTGKTTVGRALAHRLKSKFFLLDGTFITGTRNFYQRVHELFERAKQNAPSIIFIDDSDVLFENREEHGPGLYRYLLTLLDGLESETAGRVCVMMTVMDVSALPPALVRSGRVELWLDMRLPDEAARAAILKQHLAGLPSSMGPVDAMRLASSTDGFTGADLKRLVEDGKALFAFDKSRNEPVKPVTEYFVSAIETVRANKQRYAEAEARTRAQHSLVSVWPPS